MMKKFLFPLLLLPVLMGLASCATEKPSKQVITVSIEPLRFLTEQLAGDKFELIRWEGDERYSIDKLLGTNAYRTGRMSARELIEASKAPVEAFVRDTMKYRLY